jgi:hypothetical protein
MATPTASASPKPSAATGGTGPLTPTIHAPDPLADEGRDPAWKAVEDPAADDYRDYVCDLTYLVVEPAERARDDVRRGGETTTREETSMR